MIKHNYIIFASRPWLSDIAEKLEVKTGHKFILIKDPESLSKLDISSINPRYIFVLHWSWIISEKIWSNYETIVFHMTDLPFGRGGSPLQNLIVRGIEQTQISALRCSKDIDAGPIYLKRALSLEGSAKDIFNRTIPIMEEMIVEIMSSNIIPEEQHGEVTLFSRRTPEESNISQLTELSDIYNYIRMLDADGYPHAFLEHNNLHFSFTDANIIDNELCAKVKIKIKG